MRTLLQRLLPSLAAVSLAAILAHFLYHSPPDLTGVLADLPDQFTGDWAFPWDAAIGLLAAVVMWFGATGVGHLIIYRGGATRCLPTLWGRWVFAPLVGWLILSLCILILGLAGFAVRWALGTLMTVFAVAAIRGWSFLAADLRAGMEMEFEEAEKDEVERLVLEDDPGQIEARPILGGFRFTGLAFFLVAGLYLLVVPYALTPATESDELRYHLAAPAAWLESGRIEYIPHQAFSNFPFMIEMLFMMALSLQGTEGARLVHLIFLESCGILVALLGFFLLRMSARRMSAEASDAASHIAGLAGLSFVLIPCATILGAWAFIDIAVAAYFLAVVYLGALALAGPVRPPAWLMGIMIGGALGTKYTMAPLMLAMLALMLILGWWRGGRNWRGDKRVDFKYVFSAGAVGLAISAIWFIKNIVWTGNPFYPLAYGIFGGGEWSDWNAAFYAAKAGEKGLRAVEMYEMAGEKGWLFPILREPGWGKLIELFSSPITTSFFPDRFEGHFLGPIPLAAMALVASGVLTILFSRGTESIEPTSHVATSRARAVLGMWVAGVIGGSWLFWFLTYQSNRMLLPTLGVVISAGVWSYARLADPNGVLPAPRAIRAILLAGMLYAFLYTACALLGSQPREVKLGNRTWVIGTSRFARPIPVAFGLEQPEDYLSRRLEYYDAAQTLGDLLGDDERALLIGEHRTMWFEGDVIASDWFDTPQPLARIQATQNNEELIESLRADKVRYVFFNREELKKYAQAYFIPRFKPEEFARFDALVGFSNGEPHARLKEVFKDPRYDIRIYEITAPEVTPQSTPEGPSQNP